MEHYSIFVFISSILALLIAIIIAINKFRKKNSTADKAFYNLDKDQVYRDSIYKQISPDFKPYIQQLFRSLDDLRQKVSKANSEISQSQYNAMRDVYETADILSKKINDYWNSNKFNKNFFYYISLHYASLLLANSLKNEQKNIKMAFLECKRRQGRLSYQIEAAKRRHEKSREKQRYHISKQIADMCKHHKSISIWKNHMGDLNSKYNQRVTKQNIITAQYRDYIACNFGARGLNWRNRCHQRALARK